MSNDLYRLELKRKLSILKCRDSFYYFLKYLSPSEFTWNWHHKYTCNVLQDFIVNDDINRLMIFMPPQHQKSTMMTEYLPAWAFGYNPNFQTILTMYNITLAKKYNRKIQRIIDSELYGSIFPNTKLNEKNVVSTSKGAYIKNSEEFEIVGTRGFLKAVGVEGGIAGNPAKLALMDDVIKNVEQANSSTYRNKIFDWYTDELEARLHNDSKVAFTITRRHQDDLAGRLLERDGTTEEGGKWKVIKLEALKETLDNPNDPRKTGDALFPSLHSKERLEYIKKTQPRTFNSLYQQRPTIRGGGMIKGDWFGISTTHDLPFDIDNVPWHSFIDGAWTENKNNDETAISFVYHYKKTNTLYIRNIVSFRKRISESISYYKKIALENGIKGNSKTYIEAKASGGAFIDFLNNAGYNCVKINNKIVKKGKYTRVEESETFLVSGKIVLLHGGWNKSFIEQCEAFPNAKHDDKVDVLIYPIHEFLLKKRRPKVGYTK